MAETVGNEEVKKIPIAEFRALGYLQELNRLFLHPLGLAMETVEHDDGTETLGGVWDYRNDPEGVYYAGIDLEPRAEYVRRQWIDRFSDRVEALGYLIQPISWSDQHPISGADGGSECLDTHVHSESVL